MVNFNKSSSKTQNYFMMQYGYLVFKEKQEDLFLKKLQSPGMRAVSAVAQQLRR